jgi:glycosyltransferase involved in cell wall biosynthesis
MKILTIGRDKNLDILKPESAVRARNIEYGKLVEELHIIVFNTRDTRHEIRDTKIAENVFIHLTNSSSRWMFVRDAITLGKKIIVEKKLVRGNAVVTCQDPFECGFVGWRITKAFNLPLHIQIHTDFLSSHFKKSFFQRIRVITACFLLPRASGVRVVSQRIKDSIVNKHIRLHCEIQVLPIRIDVEKIDQAQKIDLQKQFPQFNFLTLMASRLTSEKRITDAITAFKKIVTEYPRTGLLIAGSGPEQARLAQYAATLGLSDNIIFLGYRADVASLMKSVHVFISTSEFEGYGMSLVEAGLSHCPVISTDVGIVGGLLHNGVNAFVCPVGDVNCFYMRIKRLISDNALREILARQLESDIRMSIPTVEDYVAEYVKGLTDTLKNI